MNSHSRAQMERSSWQERVKKSERPSLRGFFPVEREALLDDFHGEADGLNPAGQQQSTDDSEVGNDFWRISRNYIHRHHVQPMVKLCAQKGSFPIPLNFLMLSDGQMRQWMYCWKFELTTVGTLMVTESYRAEFRFFTQFTLLNEKSGRRLTKGQATSMRDYFLAEVWSRTEARQCSKIDSSSLHRSGMTWNSRTP